jgi:hypothetical protein
VTFRLFSSVSSDLHLFIEIFFLLNFMLFAHIFPTAETIEIDQQFSTYHVSVFLVARENSIRV